MIECAARLEVVALPDLPLVQPGDDLAALIGEALARADVVLRDGDVIAVASKLVSRAQRRFVDLSTVDAGERARRIARRVGKDPRLVELILRESTAVSRAVPGALIVRHRLGFVVASAGIDASNAAPPMGAGEGGPWVLLLPTDPDHAAAELRDALALRSGAAIGLVITDSFGRPFRHGTVGTAIGVAGLPALWDQRGRRDLAGRALEHTITALADQVAAAADLVAGQADEGRGAVLVRGLRFPVTAGGSGALVRAPEEDLYA